MVSAANCNVFVYGNLLADDVVRALLNRAPPSSPAILPHYHRFSIKGRAYPAIIPAENNKVIGKLLMDITPPELHILDLSEDSEYQRRTVNVFLKDSSDKVQVQVYAWQNKMDPNLFGEWDFEDWKALHMDYFVNMTKAFAQGMEQPNTKTRVATYESFYHEKDNTKNIVRA